MSRRFNPYVGVYYSSGIDGVRILAIGESHHGIDEEASIEFTTKIVQENVFEGRYPFFVKVAKLLRGMGTGEYIDNDVLRDTWSKISFYNYVQSMLPAPRVRPTDEMWQEAERHLSALVKELNPQLIVVLGKQLREHFPAIITGVEICFVEHPSSPGFTYEPWVSEIRQAIESLRRD